MIHCPSSVMEESGVNTSGMNGSDRYRRRTASEWEELISRFARAGQTRKDFRLSQGVSPTTFVWGTFSGAFVRD